MRTAYRKQNFWARSQRVLLGAWAALSTGACVALLPASAAAQTGKEFATIASGRQLQPLELKDVVVSDRFWTARQRTNNEKTIPHVFEQCKKIGHAPVEGLPPATGPKKTPRWGSDTTKWLEGACYSLITRPNNEVAAWVEACAKGIASSQTRDGYLNITASYDQTQRRWTNLRDGHELYCGGHFIEAAVAHYQATGKRTLLDAACRYADYVDSVFGRDPGKKRGYDGHEEVELALVKLYRATGEKRYLKLARYFVDERGTQPHYFEAEAIARGEPPEANAIYNQSHLPVRRQREAVGHAVRAMYLYCGMADLAGENRDAELLAACRALFDNVASQKLYLTGGVGASFKGEAFGGQYDLPNNAYAESCAAIGLALFAHRMIQADPDGRYADVMERSLYNNVLAAVSLDGQKFFYTNPLESDGSHRRSPWFSQPCCIPNIVRMVAQLGQLIYSTSPDGPYVHLYVGGSGRLKHKGRQVTITQETEYPWEGQVRMKVGVDSPGSFTLHVRIPGWCERYALKVNGQSVENRPAKGYVSLAREWRDGDEVALSLDMPVQRILPHPKIEADRGKVALQRGPLVYCLEQVDHTTDVRKLSLPDASPLTTKFDQGLLGGVVVIEGSAKVANAAAWEGKLYRALGDSPEAAVALKAVPYCVWQNRRAGSMVVWIARD